MCVFWGGCCCSGCDKVAAAANTEFNVRECVMGCVCVVCVCFKYTYLCEVTRKRGRPDNLKPRRETLWFVCVRCDDRTRLLLSPYNNAFGIILSARIVPGRKSGRGTFVAERTINTHTGKTRINCVCAEGDNNNICVVDGCRRRRRRQNGLSRVALHPQNEQLRFGLMGHTRRTHN